MQIYFHQNLNQNSQVVNIVTDRNEASGYLSFLIEEEGVCEDYKDLVKPYLQGLKKLKPEIEVMTYFAVGGKKLKLNLIKNNTYLKK